ncbi:MAG: hypothetical protein GF418_02200 [Chitinivibrionales bacterium]|nr:hypothetical protein [Chitinivibrionales bacterium]MBD3394413.1 hypothetical protein [Chitinivibrionales bacterium]
MPVNVLLADHDLDVHKLVADLLPILFKDVAIDRVLKSEGLIEKLSERADDYNLIILDMDIGDIGEQSILVTIRDRFPHMLKRVVLILDADSDMPDGNGFEDIPRITKPFSLDEFGEIVKSANVA